MHAWKGEGEGNEKHSLAKLARFLKLSAEFCTDHKIGNYCYSARQLG